MADEVKTKKQRIITRLPRLRRDADNPDEADNRDQYRRARSIRPKDFDRGIDLSGDPVAGLMADFLYYRPDGEPGYRPELIQGAYLDLLSDIWQLGRDDPNFLDYEDHRRRAAVVLAAYEQAQEAGADQLITRRQRDQLAALAYGKGEDYRAELNRMKDNRRIGPHSEAARARREKRKRASFMTAAMIDGAAQFRELNAIRRGTRKQT